MKLQSRVLTARLARFAVADRFCRSYSDCVHGLFNQTTVNVDANGNLAVFEFQTKRSDNAQLD